MMNQKRAYTRWKMKLQKAEKALREKPSIVKEGEVQWCLKHVDQYKAMMSIKSTDKRKLKGKNQS